MPAGRGLTERLATVELELPGELDLAASVERYRRWGDDLLDRWDGVALLRVGRIASVEVPYVAVPHGSYARPLVRLTVGVDERLADVKTLFTRAFVQAPSGSWADLIRRDPVVAEVNCRYPGVRPVLEADPLTALVRSISAQQVNLRWATETRRRLAVAFGVRHRVADREVWALDVDKLAAADPADVRDLQFTWAKARAIVQLAGRIAKDPRDFWDMEAASDGEVIEFLTSLPGIGRWSAEWYLARTLGRPVVVAGDLGVRKAVGRWYLGGEVASETQVRELTAHWGAAAGVAQQ
ncbi:MAG: DNA-3-methyladenine glycosylase 2 family protein, partial [Chloroflexi bacterium]|nr:DNA-3-methyladenine glycosylase 2 family protein [Chloroflexota bacterium]